MKILCTGNPDKTEFKSIASSVRDRYPDATFISGSSGYNLMLPLHEQHEFKKLIKDYDVFINCSYIGGYQFELLQSCHDAWSEQNIKGHIINMGSTMEWLGVKTRRHVYSINKRRLRDLSLTLNGVNDIKTSHIVLGGLIDNRVGNHDVHIGPDKLMDIEDVVDLVDYILNFKYHIPLIQVQKSPGYGKAE